MSMEYPLELLESGGRDLNFEQDLDHHLHKPNRSGSKSEEDCPHGTPSDKAPRENIKKSNKSGHNNKLRLVVAELEKLNYQLQCELEQKKQMDLGIEESPSLNKREEWIPKPLNLKQSSNG